MIVVKPTPDTKKIDNIFPKYVDLVKEIKSVDYNNKQLYFTHILYEATREIAQISQMIFDAQFVENNVKLHQKNKYEKKRIDLIVVEDGYYNLVLQTLTKVPDNQNTAIENLLEESLKLSFENGVKYIFWICEEIVYQAYINAYGNDFKFKFDDLNERYNFKINTIKSKDSFTISLKMLSDKIDDNVVVAFEIQ